MLYYDQVDTKRFGTIRQQFWALLHFPFHVALVLLLEGTSRFVSWRNATEEITRISNEYISLYFSTDNVTAIAEGFAEYIDIDYTFFEADYSKYNVTDYLLKIQDSGDAMSDDALGAADDVVNTVTKAALKFFKISQSKAAEKAAEYSDAPKSSIDSLLNILHVYDLVFVYFFVAAGITLITLGVMIALAKKKKVLGDYVAIGLRCVVGVGLAGVAGLLANEDAQKNFLQSAWMLPTVLIGILVVVVVDGVAGYVLPAPKTRRGHGEVHEHE